MIKLWWSGWLLAALAACGLAAPENLAAPEAGSGSVNDSVEVTLQNFGPAPELSNETWINTNRPLRLADLRGKVVLIDMWTFG